MSRAAFTLVELLVVMVVILLVSVIVLPTVITSLAERGVVAGSAELQAALAGARDSAAATRAPAGIRLLPDPTLITLQANGQVDTTKSLACNRWVPTQIPPAYTEGLVSSFPGYVYPAAVTVGLPCLVLESCPGTWVQSGAGWIFSPAEPTSWAWNVRCGERVRIGTAELTVCGPVFQATPEMFVNVSSAAAPFTRTYTAPDGNTTATAAPEYLLLVNGRDDNQDGYIDDGWDGVDNNNNGLIDEAAEWETEVWPPALAAGVTAASYQIRRRPVPIAGGAVVALPSSVVIDLTSAGVTNERSRLPVNPWTGGVDLLIFPDGTATVDLPYGVPSSLSMGAAFYHFWMAERSDVQDMPQPALPTACQLSCPPPGNVRIVTLSKSGRLTVYQPELFDPTNPGAPFQSIQQGGQWASSSGSPAGIPGAVQAAGDTSRDACSYRRKEIRRREKSGRLSPL